MGQKSTLIKITVIVIECQFGVMYLPTRNEFRIMYNELNIKYGTINCNVNSYILIHMIIMCYGNENDSCVHQNS